MIINASISLGGYTIFPGKRQKAFISGEDGMNPTISGFPKGNIKGSFLNKV